MKKSRIIAAVCIVIVAAVVLATMLSGCESSAFELVNTEDGRVEITVQNAGEDAGAIGYLTLEDGQRMEVRANLTDNSSIEIEVFPGEIDAATQALFQETVTAIAAREFELPAGEYSIRVTAKQGASGTMTIAPVA